MKQDLQELPHALTILSSVSEQFQPFLYQEVAVQGYTLPQALASTTKMCNPLYPRL